MHTEDLPTIHYKFSLYDTLFTMTSGRLGLAIVIDDDNNVVGIFTDGDLRRKLADNVPLSTSIEQVMTKNPKFITQQDMRASDALTFMNERKIGQLLVLNEQKLLGVIGLHDILKAGVQ